MSERTLDFLRGIRIHLSGLPRGVYIEVVGSLQGIRIHPVGLPWVVRTRFVVVNFVFTPSWYIRLRVQISFLNTAERELRTFIANHLEIPRKTLEEPYRGIAIYDSPCMRTYNGGRTRGFLSRAQSAEALIHSLN